MTTIRATLGAESYVEANAVLLGPLALLDHPDPHPRSWFITHGLGRPAGGTYTEVVVPITEDEDGAPWPEVDQRRLGELLVREVAVALYGTAWAFIYTPQDYRVAIKPWGSRLRERVVLDSVEVS